MCCSKMSRSISGFVAEHIAAIDVTLARLLAEAQLLFLKPPVVTASPACMFGEGAHDPHTHTQTLYIYVKIFQMNTTRLLNLT